VLCVGIWQQDSSVHGDWFDARRRVTRQNSQTEVILRAWS